MAHRRRRGRRPALNQDAEMMIDEHSPREREVPLHEMAPVDRDAASAMWNDYWRAHPDQVGLDDVPTVERFGDHAELSDALLELVMSGRKRATATLVKEFAADGVPLPRVGSHWIACDASGAPRVILRSTELRLGTIADADEAFAFDEAEDDRSLEAWLVGHRRYWDRVCTALEIEWSDDLEILFERFTVAWPETRGPLAG
ncbi:ASCH domain-containing protein [Agromyces cerinus subsp. nitratus]|uniref:ASCH domain-containing protein n=2 Tax=Agromyces cerinus TaxID=33878 RepID=UPI0036302052